MSDSAGRGAPSMVLRVSVPAGGPFSGVAADLAVKVAEYLGQPASEAKSAGAIIEALAADVGGGAEPVDITFEFRQSDDEMRIEARCAGRTSVARHPLPT